MIQYSKQAVKFLKKQDIPVTIPDEWDVDMLNSIKDNPDCRTFISAEDAMKESGL